MKTNPIQQNILGKIIILPSIILPLLLAGILHPVSSAHAQGTAFTYQGRLNDGGGSANGSYDLTFALFSVSSGAGQVGNAVTNSAIAVSNGLFTVTLDFGNQFPGADRWLEIGLRTNGGGVFTNLAPRQKLTPTPYAIFAGGANSLSGTLSAAQITGTVPLAQLPATLVTNGAGGVNFSGTFSGNGAGITNVLLNNLVKVQPPVIAWGYNGYGQTNVPAGLSNVVAIAGGQYHSLALKGDGTVVAWGDNSSGQTNIPVGLSNVVAIAGGDSHNLALKSDGTVAAWGFNGQGQTNIPAGLSNVVAIAGGSIHSLALKSDATVAAWGNGGFGQTTIPVGLSNVVAIAGGSIHSLALKSDGMVVAWGNNGYGQTNVPAGLSNVVAIAGGQYHSLALKSDGTVAAWGDNGYGQTNAPVGLSNVVKIACGSVHCLALKSDGTVAAWGANYTGQTTIPVGLSNVAAIAGGGYHSLALRQQFVPDQAASLTGNNVFQGSLTAASFTGDGSGLTSLNAANLTGSVPPAALTIVPAGNLTGSIPPAALTSIPAGNLSGTVSDARLSANVALRAGGNTFTGGQIFTSGNVGIGTPSPQQQLSVAAGLNIDQNNANSGSVANALTFGSASGEGIGCKRNAGGNQFGLDFYTGSANRLSISNNGNVAIASPGSLFFGSQTRQMLNLWNAEYGIGVQTATTYFRSGGGFSWFNGGVHNDGQNNAGGGGELMRLTSGGNLSISGTFGTLSDRNAKEQFEPLNPREVLEKVAALPLSRWNYKTDPTARHLGPMAQDFYSAFGLGTDDKHIATVDADGVALAAIQGLNQKLEQKETEIAELKQNNKSLEKRLEALEKFIRNQKPN